MGEYDLEKRTEQFAKQIMKFARYVEKDQIARPLISQLIRSASSIGAYYCEANGAESKKDFTHKISICKKEARETLYWLNLILDAIPSAKSEIDPLSKEANEIMLIFAKILRTLKEKPKVV